MRLWLVRLGVVALLVAVFGVVIQLDVRYQRALGRDFLSHGVRATATDVELDVGYCRYDTCLDGVWVVFRTAEGREIRAELIGELGDPEGADEGDRTPLPGTRYAPPVELLYQPATPSDVMAVVDAEEHSRPGTVLLVSWIMIAGGAAVAVACGVGLSRTAKVAS
jgi:hypothetical protein